jgi:hypothetical protein|tara:strand:+ start:7021 stop:7401 length:381 start_codon:yes stop_codon:yes gene_type:complete
MEEQKQTMDELLTELTEVRTNLKGLQEKERGFKSRKMELEAKIVSTLKQQGIDRVGNDGCTVSIKEEIVPTVQDWDEVYKYLIQTKQFELIQKRMSATAFRELLQMGMNVPGVKATELTRVNFRSK